MPRSLCSISKHQQDCSDMKSLCPKKKPVPGCLKRIPFVLWFKNFLLLESWFDKLKMSKLPAMCKPFLQFSFAPSCSNELAVFLGCPLQQLQPSKLIRSNIIGLAEFGSGWIKIRVQTICYENDWKFSRNCNCKPSACPEQATPLCFCIFLHFSCWFARRSFLCQDNATCTWSNLHNQCINALNISTIKHLLKSVKVLKKHYSCLYSIVIPDSFSPKELL